MAPSRHRPDTVWVHNDSGHQPWLYAIDRQGRVLGQAAVHEVRNRDWEDLASFVWKGRSYLVIGDLGDNLARHREVRLHIVPEPRLQANRVVEKQVRPIGTITFTYPDGPRDAEALAADPAGHRFLVLSKREGRPQIYSVPMGLEPKRSPLVAQPVAVWETPSLTVRLFSRAPVAAPLIASMPTAMDLAPDGRSLLVLDYSRVWWVRFVPASLSPLEPIALLAHGLDQAEAACFSSDGREIWVTTEGQPTLLKIYALPGSRPPGP